MSSVEDDTPTTKDLNRYITKKKYAIEWKDIGAELGLDDHVLDIIENDHDNQSVACFKKTLNQWIRLTPNKATWRALEVALTNVTRQSLELDPVDDVYGEDLYIISKPKQPIY